MEDNLVLSPAEVERLALLMEEMAECQQVIGKILRHGYDSKHPSNTHGPDNRQLLERELGDMLFVFNMMVSRGDVDVTAIHAATLDKSERIKKYLHHQEDVTI